MVVSNAGTHGSRMVNNYAAQKKALNRMAKASQKL